MSVLIKDMGKPKSCYAVIDGEYEYCPFVNTDDDCVLLLKKGTCEGTWAGQYSKCPLIEAPELCEDAVSRQAAIDALEKIAELYPWRVPGDRDSYSPYNEAWNDALNRAESEIEALPSVHPEQRWIPCSERLPEHSERYLVTALDGTDRRTTVVPYHPQNKTWTLTGRMAYWRVLAWMPLPEPYVDDIPIEYFESGGI